MPSSSHNQNHTTNNKTHNSTISGVIRGEIHNLLGILRHEEHLHNRFQEEVLYEYDATAAAAVAVAGLEEDVGLEYDRYEEEGAYDSVIRSRMDLVSNLRRLNDACNHPNTPRSSQQSKIQQQQQLYNEYNDEYDHDIHHNHDKEQPMDVYTMVQPFCAAVSMPEINASITGAALSSLHKFVLYQFLTLTSPGILQAMTAMATSIRQCTFETTIPDHNHAKYKYKSSSSSLIINEHEEEVVLKLLALSSAIIRCPTSILLTSKQIHDIFSTCLHVTIQEVHPASQLLRSAAADVLAHIVLVVSNSTRNNIDRQDHSDDHDTLLPILQQLVEILDPRSHPPQHCILGLRLMNIVLETAGSTLYNQKKEHEQLLHLLQNDMCQHLLLLSTHADLQIFSLTLRVIYNLFHNIKQQMKVQLEVFLTSVHLRILSRQDPEKCEVVLEGLLEFCQEPALMLDLYVNYDCDVHCTNLFEIICCALAEQAGVPGVVTVLHRLSLEGMLAVVDAICARCVRVSSYEDDDSNNHEDDSYLMEDDHVQHTQKPSHKLLKQRKIQKQNLSLAANAFNTSNDWLSYAKTLNILPSQHTPLDVARFLFTTGRLHKARLGLYLSKGPVERYPFNAEVLKEFTGMCVFEGMEFSEALRYYLGKFRLPGEAQCIDRLMECFAKEYYAQQQRQESDFEKATNVNIFKNADTLYVLAFSIIMLNTDLHNPNMEDDRRMTLQQFIRNNRGINDGEDLPVEFLEELYRRIKEEEIAVLEEESDVVDGVVAVDDTGNLKWNEDRMQLKTKQVATPFFTPSSATHCPASQQDKDMLLSISTPLLECMSSLFQRTNDGRLIGKILRGYQQICRVCVYFQLKDLFNEVIGWLMECGREYVLDLSIAGVRGENVTDLPRGILNHDAHDPSNHKSTTSHRGLLSLHYGIHLIERNPTLMQQAWPSFIYCLFALRDAKALPISLAELDDFADSRGNILPPSRFAQRAKRRWENYKREMYTKLVEEEDSGSLWESVSKVVAPIEEKVEVEVKGKLGDDVMALLQKVAAPCDQIVMQKRDLPYAKSVLESLLEAVDSASFEQYSDSPLFEYHSVYALELAARVLLCHRKKAAELYPAIFARLRTILSGGQSKKTPYLIERACVTILRSCIHLFDIPEMRPILLSSLETLCHTSEEVTEEIASRLACGMAIILLGSFSSLETRSEWILMGKLLQKAAINPSGRQIVFDGIASCMELSSVEHKGFSSIGRKVLMEIIQEYLNEKNGQESTQTKFAMDLMRSLYSAIQQDNDFFDEKMWLNVALKFYETSLSSNFDVSQHAIECVQKHIVSIHNPSSLSDIIWITLYQEIIVKRPPSLTRTKVRTTCLIILSRSLLLTLTSFHLFDQMTNVIEGLALMVRENISGRHDGILFESTVQHVTNMVNVIEVLLTTAGDSSTSMNSFISWAGRLLRGELENVGAAGGCVTGHLSKQSLSLTSTEDVDDTNSLMSSNSDTGSDKCKGKEAAIEKELTAGGEHSAESR